MADETWDSIADWYADLVRGGSPAHALAHETALSVAGDVVGKRVLDVGCGEGALARAFASRGARVTGVDLSKRLVLLAERQEQRSPLGISFRVDDATTLATVANASADVIIGCLSLNGVTDLDAALASIARASAANATLVVVVPHPCFETPHAAFVEHDGRARRAVGGYFDEGFWRSTNPEGVRRAGNVHRTITTYVRGLTAHGFAIVDVDEPRATSAMVAERKERVEVPMFLAMRAMNR